MYELLTEVSGVDGRPGDLLPPAAFAGCDLGWLVRSGAVRPVGLAAAAPGDGHADPLADVAELTEALERCRAELQAERLAHEQTRAAGDGGKAARIAALEAELQAAADRHAAEQLGHEQAKAELAELKAAAPAGEPEAAAAETTEQPANSPPAGGKAVGKKAGK